MKNRSDAEFLRVYNEIMEDLKLKGLKPTYHRLDNEASKAYKAAITQHDITYQLVPPGNKETNNAERAIQIWKAHFITILSIVDPNFPLSLWDYLVPQTNHTINMLCQS